MTIDDGTITLQCWAPIVEGFHFGKVSLAFNWALRGVIKINQFANLDIRLISISFVLVQGLLPPPNSTSASASTKRRERTAKRVIASCTTWFPCIHTRKRFIVHGWLKPAGSIQNIAWMRSFPLSLSSVDIRIIAFYGPFHHRGWRALALGDGTCTTTKIYTYIILNYICTYTY